MRAGFRFLGGIFALLLALPALVFTAGVAATGSLELAPSNGPGGCRDGAVCVFPADAGLAGILLTGAAVVASALNARTRTALLAASAFVAATGLVALAVVPMSGHSWAQLVALGLFLFAGAVALAMAAPPAAPRPEPESVSS